jgi:CRP/FNR family transcriptional regulator, cyclic AMP receptor protein
MASAADPSPAAFVLEIDPDLGGDIDPAEWEGVRQACRGELLNVPRGHWIPGPGVADRVDLVGWVIVDGLLVRELSLRDHGMVELLGAGDVLQPPTVVEPPRLGTHTRLTAVTELVLLVLGRAFVRAAARWPTLLTALQRRLEWQRESLALQGLIAHLPNAEHRLLVMLWHLTDRWGYVTPDGIVLPWALNHEILGRLIGARRPTVTLALRHLEAGGEVQRREDRTWVLTAVAERTINAITKPTNATHSVGERLALYRQVTQTTAHTRALQAQAKQIRSQHPAPSSPLARDGRSL